MERITRKHLETLAETLARQTRQNIKVSSTCGGYKLVIHEELTGGERDLISAGHRPAREVYDIGHAFLEGWYRAKEGWK